ncbi:glycosyltransferase [Sporosarcina thermotolerans]|uniref:Glycosyltransferase n=1 Tax=Sporosarcina thermotolerans TaxID=633404 RepID=A0AAW9A4P2_9BACL|nr:glycosyltransferase [Sporosarcina thermotolerans]MDW0116281.1 glycosyltransferase [Sporosarcina thermotolerans]
MKRKIAFLIPSLRGGGAERVTVNIIRNLDPNKFDIKLILLKKEGPYLRDLPENIEVVDLNTTRVRNSLIPLIKVLNIIRPDVIFSTMGHLNIAVLAIKYFIKGNPKIIVREANTPSKDIRRNKKMFTFLYKYLYPKADLIIAQCDEMKNDIMHFSNVKGENIQYIYNPLDINNIREMSVGISPYYGKMVNFLSVGRLTQQKGFDTLINAFTIVSKNIPNAHLTILGEGELKSTLQTQVNVLGMREKVSFVGFKNNPYPYYKNADVFVLSSRWEGFPNTLLEALACGVKVVSTNCKSGPYEILGGNEYGNLSEEGDYKSLAKEMIASHIEVNKTGNRADVFDIKHIIKKYESIFLTGGNFALKNNE